MITTTVQFGDFYEWTQKSDNYNNNFTYEGAKALFNYLEEYSEEVENTLEFDPIAWCCEFSEYKNLKELQDNYQDIKTLEELQEKTTVIQFDGGLIISEF